MAEKLKPVFPKEKPTIQSFTTEELIEEIKRRSIGCLLCAIVLEDGGQTKDVQACKGSPIIFQSVCLFGQQACKKHYEKFGLTQY
jgi:hypothetical protein